MAQVKFWKADGTFEMEDRPGLYSEISRIWNGAKVANVQIGDEFFDVSAEIEGEGPYKWCGWLRSDGTLDDGSD